VLTYFQRDVTTEFKRKGHLSGGRPRADRPSRRRLPRAMRHAFLGAGYTLGVYGAVGGTSDHRNQGASGVARVSLARSVFGGSRWVRHSSSSWPTATLRVLQRVGTQL